MYEFDSSDDFWTKFNLSVRLPFFNRKLAYVCFKLLEKLDQMNSDDMLHMCVEVYTKPSEHVSKSVMIMIAGRNTWTAINIMQYVHEGWFGSGRIAVRYSVNNICKARTSDEVYTLDQDAQITDNMLDRMNKIYKSMHELSL